MGAATSCCKKPVLFVEDHNRPGQGQPHESIRSNLDPDLKQEPLAFPRYPVLPDIDNYKDNSQINGHTLTKGNASGAVNLFNKYKDPSSPQISAEGIERLCNDLELSPEDFRILVLAYRLGAEVMCQFTEDEFVKGCEKLCVTDIQSMKDCIPRLLNTVKGDGFSPFYSWSYKFALDQENGQRTLPIDIALSMWRLVFTQNKPVLLDKWLSFLEKQTHLKGISKDTWDMFLVFVEQIGDNLKVYDDTEAWPSLLDDFVEYELDQTAGNDQ